MDILWRAANYFNWHPWRALGVSLILWGLLFLTLILRGWRPYTLPLLVASSA